MFFIYVEELLSFKYNSLRFEFLHRVLTFFIRLVWFFSAISIDIFEQCSAQLSSCLFSKCIQNLIIFMLVIFFSGSRPNSFLYATFGHCLFTPRTCLVQNWILFSVLYHSPMSYNYLYRRCSKPQIHTSGLGDIVN